MKNLVRKIYAFSFFDDLILIYPLYAVMFVDFGMEPWQIATLFVVWSVTSLLLEVPSGVLADKYSRKRLLFWGQIIRALGYAIWIFFPNFVGFLVGFILWGIKGALTSGTFEALLYDELKKQKQESQYTKVLGGTRASALVAILIASALASPAIALGYAAVLWISIGAVLVSGFIVLTFPKAVSVESTHEQEYFTILKAAVQDAFKNKALFRIIVFLTLVFAIGGALDEYWAIIATEAGLALYGIGLFLAVVSGAEAIAAYMAHRVEKYSPRLPYLLFTGGGFILILFWYFFNVPALLLLVAFSFVFTLTQTIYESKLQHEASNQTRATVTSISSFSAEIVALAVFGAFGLTAQMSTDQSYSTALLAVGVLTIFVGVVYLIRNGSLFYKRGVKKTRDKVPL